MEENLRRDIYRGFASFQELEVPSRWNYFSGQFYSSSLNLISRIVTKKKKNSCKMLLCFIKSQRLTALRNGKTLNI